MKWGAIFGMSVLMVCIVLFQWPKLAQNQKKEKVAFLSLSFLGWALAILLIIYPDMVGPTEFIGGIFKPLGKLLEK